VNCVSLPWRAGAQLRLPQRVMESGSGVGTGVDAYALLLRNSRDYPILSIWSVWLGGQTLAWPGGLAKVGWVYTQMCIVQCVLNKFSIDFIVGLPRTPDGYDSI
jgi:hypothetical protein